MAQISFETACELESNRPQGGSSSGDFRFFWLANDGDEAVVRIMHDTTSSFQIFTVHDIDLQTDNGSRKRKVSCLRSPQDPTNMCPLCASGASSKNVIFINMIQYVTNPDGTITPTPVIWERSLSYATKLKGLIDEYGPLSDCIFKIKRFGEKGSVNTTYEFFFGNPKQYPDMYYPKDESLFSNIKILGSLVMDKNFDELVHYNTYRSFPQRESTTSSQQSSVEQYTPKTNSQQTYTPAEPQHIAEAEVRHYDPVPASAQYVPVNNVPPVAGSPQRQAPPVQTSAPAGPPQRATRYY